MSHELFVSKFMKAAKLGWNYKQFADACGYQVSTVHTKASIYRNQGVMLPYLKATPRWDSAIEPNVRNLNKLVTSIIGS